MAQNEILVIYIVLVVLLIAFYFKKQGEKAAEARKLREESFLVQEDGGVLQRMRKDEDGNIKLRLGKKIKVTDDTFIFRFSFTDPEYTYGLPIG